MMNSQMPKEINSPTDIIEACKTFKNTFYKIKKELASVIVGKTSVIDLILVAIFADGHVLIEGPPGLGKTLIVETLAKIFKFSYSRIQCTTDLMPGDIFGTMIVFVSKVFKLKSISSNSKIFIRDFSSFITLPFKSLKIFCFSLSIKIPFFA